MLNRSSEHMMEICRAYFPGGNVEHISQNVTGGKQTGGNIEKIRSYNGTVLTDMQEIANEFNSHFGRATESLRNFTNYNYDLAEQEDWFPKIHIRESFFLFPVDKREVNAIIKGLQPKRSKGIDGIAAITVKKLSDYVSPVFAYIANLSMETGIFPEQFKTAIVVPIHKKGDRLDLNNYRPISLLPVFSKILEKIVKTRLLNFLNRRGFFSNNQFGFLKGKCTEDALLHFCSNLYEGLNKCNKVAGLFIDITKAFDTVDHKILLERLQQAGVRGIALSWFQSYLCDRSQYVHIKNCNSNKIHISRGVPQGSVLGPILFLILVNNLCNGKFHGKLTSFADDTALCYSDSSMHELHMHMQRDLDKLKYWFSINSMVLSSKTKYILFNLKNVATVVNSLIYYRCMKCITDDVLFCNQCVLIDRVSHIKYLGIYIDEHCNWKQHINKLKSELIYVLKKFYLLQFICPAPVLRMVYCALVNSRLQYGIVCWGGAYQTNLQPLFVAQKKIIRAMVRAPRTANSYPLFLRLNILPLRHLFIFKVLRIFYNRGGEREKPRGYDLRGNPGVHVPRPKNELFRQSFLYLGPRIFSSLPVELAIIKNEKRFALCIRKWLLGIKDVKYLITKVA